MAVLPTGIGPVTGGYNVERSLRFNSADSAYLNRTPASAGNRKTWTLSLWNKGGNTSANDGYILSTGGVSTERFAFSIRGNGGALNVVQVVGGVVKLDKQTTALHRDPSAWYHFVLSVDTTQSTPAVNLYVNGVQITSFSTNTNTLAQNDNTQVNNTNEHDIGKYFAGSDYLNGYLTEVNFVDGQALTPSSFGETDSNTGVWKPKAYTGTYGTNGFYLPFKTANQWSGFFDGTGDYVTVANNAALNFGTSAFTVECWFYRTASAAVYGLWSLNSVTSGYAGARAQINTNGSIDVYISQNGSSWANSITNRGSTTVNTWNHLAVVRESNGDIKIYINGTQAGATVTNANSLYAGTSHLIAGVYSAGSPSSVFPGYISNLRSVVGTAVYTGNFTPPTSQLTAITNTQLLTLQSSTFVDNSANALTVTAAGDARAQQFSPFTLDVTDDHSGQGNHWIPNNLDLRTTGVGADILVDSPTSYGTDTGVGGEVRGNYCTLNPLDKNSNLTLSNGNLDFVPANTSDLYSGRSTFQIPSTGKWIWQVTNTNSAYMITAGLIDGATPLLAQQTVSCASMTVGSIGTFFSTTQWMNTTTSWSVTNVGNGDTLVIAYDADAGKIWFGRVASGGSTVSWYNTSGTADPSTGTDPRASGITAGKWFAGVGAYYTPSGASINYGQRPFAFTNAPSGFKALCTQNLPTPTIGATSTTQANDYFNAVLYSGNSSTQAITGVGFQPDFVWCKARSTAAHHIVTDAVRTAAKVLSTSQTAAESAWADNAFFQSLNSDGFTLTGGGTAINTTGNTYAAWNWKANGAGSSNTAGTITSTVSANTTSGFSIVTYTGTGANATVGHGIGIAPTFIIVKRRNSAVGWPCLVKAANSGNGQNGRLNLNETATYADNIEFWNNTSPTSTVFSVGISVGTNASGGTYVAYCFAPVAGYSAFGSYTGNGSTDGPFVFTNMRPRFLLVKRTDSADDWVMYDSARDPYNQVVLDLRANSSAAEASASSDAFDFLSNGFKLRGTTYNASGGTYIYAAFAEAPFKYSLGR